MSRKKHKSKGKNTIENRNEIPNNGDGQIPSANNALETGSDWSAKSFVDLGMKMSRPLRDKHWQEAALRSWSNKKLYLMAMLAFYEKYGSLIEKASPELKGLEQIEMERGRG